jgi:HK97 family phage portal protein
MAIIDRILERRSNLANPDPWLMTALGFTPSNTGKIVTADSAMASTAVGLAVRILAETIGSLPLSIYKSENDLATVKAEDRKHPLYKVLNVKANPEMSAYELKECLMGHLALRGNAYAEKQFDGAGKIVALWPIQPTRCRPKRLPGGQLVYTVDVPNKGEVDLPRAQVWHIRLMSKDGLVGMSPISLHKEAVGLSLAAEEFGARLFANDARPGGYLTHPATVSQEAQDRLLANWNNAHQGLTNAHRTALLEEGMGWQEVGIAPEDAQMLQTRKFQVAEIARIFNVPLHKLKDLDRSTFSNVEQTALDWVINDLQGWFARWEGAIARDLFTDAELSAGYFAKFNALRLLRGDAKVQAESSQIRWQSGALSQDEWRAEDGLNPIEGGHGAKYFVMANMSTVENIVNPPKPPAPVIVAPPKGEDPAAPPADPAKAPVAPGARSEERAARPSAAVQHIAAMRRRMRASHRGAIQDAVSRTLKREQADVMRSANKMLGKRDSSGFTEWLQSFYADHKEFIQTTMTPAMIAYAQSVAAAAADETGFDLPEEGLTPDMKAFCDDYVATYADRSAGLSLGVLKGAMSAEGAAGSELAALAAVFAGWMTDRADQTARYETVRSGDAFAKQTYKEAGVTRMVWVASGDLRECNTCADLDGQVVGIESNFIDAGSGALDPGSDIGHAPAHDNCGCTVVAEAG